MIVVAVLLSFIEHSAYDHYIIVIVMMGITILFKLVNLMCRLMEVLTRPTPYLLGIGLRMEV